MSHPTPLPNTELDSELLNDPQVQVWFEKHLADLRQDAYGPRLLYSVLVGAFVVGLIAYVIGYLLRTTAPAEPLGLLADMVYTFGFALWTGAVVVVLVEIIPEVKRRQIQRSLEAYEAIRSSKERKGTEVIEQM